MRSHINVPCTNIIGGKTFGRTFGTIHIYTTYLQAGANKHTDRRQFLHKQKKIRTTKNFIMKKSAELFLKIISHSYDRFSCLYWWIRYSLSLNFLEYIDKTAYQCYGYSWAGSSRQIGLITKHFVAFELTFGRLVGLNPDFLCLYLRNIKSLFSDVSFEI